jgi:hypothetical protein
VDVFDSRKPSLLSMEPICFIFRKRSLGVQAYPIKSSKNTCNLLRRNSKRGEVKLNPCCYCYAGSRVTSIMHPSRLGSSRFNKVIVRSGMRIRPLLYILVKKLSLTPNKPTIVTVTFKTSDDSTLNSHRTNLGTCKQFCFCNIDLKLTL